MLNAVLTRSAQSYLVNTGMVQSLSKQRCDLRAWDEAQGVTAKDVQADLRHCTGACFGAEVPHQDSIL